MADEFHEVSKKLTKEIPLVERKTQGIYFTPKSIRARVLEIIDGYHRPVKILEPSFGSGEFLMDGRVRWPGAEITGVEKNEHIYEYIHTKMPDISLYNMDFLEFPKENRYDTIIGNPPFFVIKPAPVKEPALSLYKESSSGRCNIFVLFLYKCLRYHLAPGGVLGLVLPTSIYNCSYYDKCRKYISHECTILHTEKQRGKFMGTTQDTCILVIQKIKKDQRYIVPIGGRHLIIPEYETIQKILLRPHTTIHELGGHVQTGAIVWNQVKPTLVDEESSDTAPLIYDHSITDMGLDLTIGSKNNQKKRFVNIMRATSKPLDCESIVIRRGYGNTFKFRYAMAPPGVYGENHVNMVTGHPDKLRQIYTSLGDTDTILFGKIVFGNGSISKSELEHVLPIFVG